MMNFPHYQELNDFDFCDMTECVYEDYLFVLLCIYNLGTEIIFYLYE